MEAHQRESGAVADKHGSSGTPQFLLLFGLSCLYVPGRDTDNTVHTEPNG